jgi:hypothetical protein
VKTRPCGGLTAKSKPRKRPRRRWRGLLLLVQASLELNCRKVAASGRGMVVWEFSMPCTAAVNWFPAKRLAKPLMRSAVPLEDLTLTAWRLTVPGSAENGLLQEQLAAGGKVAGDVGGAEAGTDLFDGGLNLVDDAGGAVAGEIALGHVSGGILGDAPCLVDLGAEGSVEEGAHGRGEETDGDGDVDGLAGVWVWRNGMDLGLEAGDVDGAGEDGDGLCQGGEAGEDEKDEEETAEDFHGTLWVPGDGWGARTRDESDMSGRLRDELSAFTATLGEVTEGWGGWIGW